MDKDEMIKGMAKVITDLEDLCSIECRLKCDCEDCEYRDKEQGGIGCIEYAIAENLYNAGFCKIDEDEIVLNTSKTKHLTDEKAIAFFAEHNAKVREEMKKEILSRFNINNLFYILRLVNNDYENKTIKMTDLESTKRLTFHENLITDIQGVILMIAGERAIIRHREGKW